MSDKEFDNVFLIPPNYTDSGRALGGMVEVRNLVEAGFLILVIGYPELKFIPFSLTVKIGIMVLTLLPAAIFALFGIDGNSLFQYLGHIIKYMFNRRKLHFRRVGYKYDERKIKKTEKSKVRKFIETVADILS